MCRPPRLNAFRSSIPSTRRLTALPSCYLRLTHIVTSTSPRLAAECAEALPRVDLNHRNMCTSWRTRTFITTTNNSAPTCWHRYFTFRLRLIVFPFTSNSRFPRSDTTPVLRSCLLYPGCRLINNQDFSKLLPRHQTSLGFDNVFILSRPHQRFVCTHLRRTYSPLRKENHIKTVIL